MTPSCQTESGSNSGGFLKKNSLAGGFAGGFHSFDNFAGGALKFKFLIYELHQIKAYYWSILYY